MAEFDRTKSWPATKSETQREQDIVLEVKKRFKTCFDWEAEARVRFDYDYKFANGDTHNKYQWDNDLVSNRELEDKPCLTINKTNQHNLMIINDAKQNKPGVRIRPVGDDASFEAAQIVQEIIYHIEYISGAENVYDAATVWQVEAGIGYWRIQTDFISDKSFDQEIYIRKIKDPRSVFLDTDIVETGGLDARFGIIFEDIAKDLYQAEHPDFATIGSQSLFGISDGWLTQDTIRVAEYFRKTENNDKLVTWVNPNEGTQVLKLVSELDEIESQIYKALKGNKNAQPLYQFRERKVVTNDIEWFKIAGDRIIEEGKWLGKYIPIVRVVGTETVIDGILDRKGHTRALINAQQIYNYNTSANVEYGALQTKSPWLAPMDAVEGFEEYWKTANTKNHSYLPYNHLDEDGKSIPTPTRPQPPQPGPAYVQAMEIAQNEMMMASGQYQAQFGEQENAKSGVAINARQRQGDRATYHFIDNLAIAIRDTGKILIDLFPKIYDTKRVQRITASDGSILEVTIDPNAEQSFQNVTDNANPKKDNGKIIKEIVFNPNLGLYDIQSDSGPSFATKRMEAVNALTQIAASDKNFMGVGGDIYFGMLDFPKADVLADRYNKLLPPALKDQPVDPQMEELMHKASDHIQQQAAMITDLQQQLKDKQAQLTQSGMKIDLEHKKAITQEAREDYKAETERLGTLGNAGPGVSVEQIQPVLKELLAGMIANGELILPGKPGPHEGGMPAGTDLTNQEGDMGGGEGEETETEGEPPVPGARKAPDGNWYVPDPSRQGKYLRVNNASAA